ncbi:glycerol-3-phosphate dehydrogenase subunit GlpB [Desulfobaculum bizertense]|uniref:Glycerol 3-phosphate dehydrogenase (Quinone) subunit B n=1 Tax=Desulfobaculum bizertense DSM 18034 TaxID=1121442 RepID=A0A1T4WE94_9BACT|nr:glycerol-3-phosphate dehydrogenase subunit GlpB [Desulfobaculum bizertense]UIJ36717.1 glycerol-3-phosphate dehydrogenase subunit GlpB [Desulfobaculum bizertense]SKA75623.1 glycerol 3-phosphate dehydrogenase (quinone) subunit B [Desulfobaculum bizertense DSM 18034]
MPDRSERHFDVMVIGAGMAGMAASIFAADRGLKVAQAGVTGESVYTSGVMDIMGVHPVADAHVWGNPFDAMKAVAKDIPGHPYAKLTESDVRDSFKEFLGFFEELGIHYCHEKDANSDVLTAMGTLKHTYAVPETMWAGTVLRKKKAPCLFVGFRGLKGFSPKQIASVQGKFWPGLKAAVVEFPGCEEKGEIYPQQMAQALEFEGNREALVERIRPHLADAAGVGIPAIVGIYHCREILADLAERLGVPVFEIPSLPPSVPGLRIKEAFDRHIEDRGVTAFRQKNVLSARYDAAEKEFVLEVGFGAVEYTLRTKAVILGTGRFLGGGLFAARKGIEETVFGLPVSQPEERDAWHQKDFMNPAGHPVNRSGLETDEQFRPLGAEGSAAYARLYACGSVLAHQDWMREKCGCGLALASAFKAVDSLAADLKADK